MTPLRNPLAFALLVLAALASTVIFLQNRAPPATPATARLDIGYYVRDARLSGTGPDGRVLYRLRAAEARQDLADGSVSLEDIVVSYEPAAAVPWELSARTGRMAPGGNIIVLSGDVVAVSPQSTPPTLIRTDSLELDPDSYVARTARDVTVERARDTLRARGMEFFLREDRLQLESQVQGRFLP